MRKYSMVHDVVTRLTDDPTLRTFFTVYLMARSDEERQALGKKFWQDAEILDEVGRQVLKDAFNRSFEQLLPLANQLYDKVVAAKAKATVPA
jgi:hypothetical protein